MYIANCWADVTNNGDPADSVKMREQVEKHLLNIVQKYIDADVTAVKLPEDPVFVRVDQTMLTTEDSFVVETTKSNEDPGPNIVIFFDGSLPVTMIAFIAG